MHGLEKYALYCQKYPIAIAWVHFFKYIVLGLNQLPKLYVNYLALGLVDPLFELFKGSLISGNTIGNINYQ